MIHLLINITVIIFLNIDIFCQSINKTWVSDKPKTCIEFDSLTKRLNIGNYYTNYKEGKSRFEYEIKGEKLKIIWYFGKSLIGYHKEISWFKILKLTSDTLSLELIKRNDREAIPELLGDSILFFRQTNTNCSSFYKKNK